MFSGQGSQYYQMGKELYENNSLFRHWMDRCNEIAAPLIQTSLIDVLYKGEGKGKPFDRLLYSSPALFGIEYSIFQLLKKMGVKPDYLLGYSLGEIIASAVSGFISFEDGIQLVIELSRLVEEKTEPAAMLAIMCSKMIVVEYPEFFSNCWITGTNFRDNFVVSGLTNDIKFLQQSLSQEGIASQILPVKYGFHTKLIEPVKDEFKKLVCTINPLSGQIPIISSSKAEIVHELNDDFFWEVIRYPVHFEKTLENRLAKGDYLFIDLGPSGTMATFVEYTLSVGSGSIPLPTINQFGRDLNMIEKLKKELFMDVY